jgi:hypothetical protein
VPSVDDEETLMPDPMAPRPPLTFNERFLLALVVLAVLAGGGLWWWRRSQPPPPPPPPPAEVAPAPEPPVGPAPAAAPLEAGDRERALLEAVSTSPVYRSWLQKGDVLNRWALVTDNLAEGVSPRKALEFLAPATPFTVEARGGVTVVSARSFQRYDLVGDAVASVDPGALAAVYRALHPVLEAAYRALGYPSGSLDKVAARALARLVKAPLVAGDLAVEPAGPIVYILTDPRLEALGAVEKHLLRMGPRNGRLIHEKAVALQKALGLGAAATP